MNFTTYPNMHIDINTFAAITGVLIGLIGALIGTYIGLMNILRNINFDSSLTAQERWKEIHKSTKFIFNVAMLTLGFFFFTTLLIVFCKVNNINDNIYVISVIILTLIYMSLIGLLSFMCKSIKIAKS